MRFYRVIFADGGQVISTCAVHADSKEAAKRKAEAVLREHGNPDVLKLLPDLAVRCEIIAGEGARGAHPLQHGSWAADALARFMATGSDDRLALAFAESGLTIIENFPPFLFTGEDALARWVQGFRAHAERNRLADLSWSFGEPQDFACVDDRAFFVLPTTWTGKACGRPFAEHGGWAFVLECRGNDWRILSYAWAVTSKG